MINTIDFREVLQLHMESYLGKNYFRFSYPIMSIFTFIRADTLDGEGFEYVKGISNWLEIRKVHEHGNCIWILDEEMDKNILCRDSGITISPTTLICDSSLNIRYQRIGLVSESHLNRMYDLLISEQ